MQTKLSDGKRTVSAKVSERNERQREKRSSWFSSEGKLLDRGGEVVYN